MKTDIDRLHAVIEGKITGRGVGRTYAKCHEIAGILEVTDVQDIYLIVTHMSDRYYILPMLISVLDEHFISKAPYRSTDQYITVYPNRKIWFISEYNFDKRLRGCEGAIVYMRHED